MPHPSASDVIGARLSARAFQNSPDGPALGNMNEGTRALR